MYPLVRVRHPIFNNVKMERSSAVVQLFTLYFHNGNGYRCSRWSHKFNFHLIRTKKHAIINEVQFITIQVNIQHNNKMVSFNKSNAAIVALLAASLATSTDAYGRTYLTQSRPSTALRSSLGRSLFSDMDRMMNEMDTMMDDMLGDLYSSYSFEPRRLMTRRRPSAYLLPGMPSTSAVANAPPASATRRAPVKNSLGIMQDDNDKHRRQCGRYQPTARE